MKNNIYYYNDNWKDKYIHPELLTKDWEIIPYEFENRGVGTDIYCIPIFNKIFCDELLSIAHTAPEGETIQEVDGEPVLMAGWGTNRHVNYPTYDIELKSLGLYSVYEAFMNEFIYPLMYFIYKEYKQPPTLVSESFLVKYTSNNKSLGCHMDSSLASVNISLNDSFVGGGTYFPKQKLLQQPKLGYGIIHPGGVSHKHGAKSILKGERYQLVSFCNTDDDTEEAAYERIMTNALKNVRKERDDKK